MSQTVRWRDARAIFQLLGEVKQLGAEPLAWRRHLLEGLLPLIGAEVGVAAEALGGQLLDGRAHRGAVDVGWATPADQRVWMSVCERTEQGLDPSDPAIARLGRRSFAYARPSLVDSQAWRNSAIATDHYRPAGLGDYLLASFWAPTRGLSHFLMLMKPVGKTFGVRECDLVSHLQRELGAMWQSSPGPQLPPSLRRTLRLLEQGRSEKEIASELQLSPHTVRDQCKALHRRFNVHSRGELLAATRRVPQGLHLVSDQPTH